MFQAYSPKAKKNANTLRFKIPGFQHPIYVPFTGRRLAVCERCKKNFKTRDQCRTRDCHIDLPWSETYVCVSLDPSCTDDDNQLLDGCFFARAVAPIAFNYNGELDRSTPICAPCKDKNYTRRYCRLQKKHRQLPWSTVYVILTLNPPEDIFAEGLANTNTLTHNLSMSRKLKQTASDSDENNRGGEDYDSRGSKVEGKDNDEDNDSDEDKKPTSNKSSADKSSQADDEIETVGEDDNDKTGGEQQKKLKKPENKVSEEEEAKKLEDIPPSRTMLCTISSRAGCFIEWLELDPVLQSQYPHLRNFGSRNFDMVSMNMKSNQITNVNMMNMNMSPNNMTNTGTMNMIPMRSTFGSIGTMGCNMDMRPMGSSMNIGPMGRMNMGQMELGSTEMGQMSLMNAMNSLSSIGGNRNNLNLQNYINSPRNDTMDANINFLTRGFSGGSSDMIRRGRTVDQYDRGGGRYSDRELMYLLNNNMMNRGVRGGPDSASTGYQQVLSPDTGLRGSQNQFQYSGSDYSEMNYNTGREMGMINSPSNPHNMLQHQQLGGGFGNLRNSGAWTSTFTNDGDEGGMNEPYYNQGSPKRRRSDF